ncbi:hypothetical protein [Mucilaginibacter sp. 44-25]|uniref:hypothetical protein n=2 Tax=unclassified Mucilaginibacter TaxID=2617802 RepID=UPI0009620E8F|nr:hypothetical protein [Mucilaginibacter sp. 44-25]OJW13485.1 MAG: hypothetical protein BGO48_01640 [Mucilaginibacter sp. 44-25]PLW89937.1 MAG: hypothetical protein C0154_08985 [Mucilaginibacter sp.]
MFETSYDFVKVCKNQALNKPYLYETILYRFETPVTRYTVEVEHYHHDIFIIKFYRNSDRKNKLKFNILTNEFNSTKIIATCVHIMLSILNKKPLASFGFIGANTIDSLKNYNEQKNFTKRFRVYKQAMENLIGENLFHHSMDTVNSAYLMINNRNKSTQDILSRAKIIFEKIYPEMNM